MIYVHMHTYMDNRVLVMFHAACDILICFRLKTVEEKLDQRWRAQCEELRSVVSKQTVVSVSRERQQQLKLKEEARNRQHEGTEAVNSLRSENDGV